MTANNRRFSENRMSIESGITFSSILSKELFNGEETFDVSPYSPRRMAPPVKVIKPATKRPSAQEFDGLELFSGQDLADIFQQQHTDHGGAPMRMSFTSTNSRRYSNISRMTDRRESIMSLVDRRESIMSLMSLADYSILEDQSQLEETLDMRERSNNSNTDNVHVPSNVIGYPSTQKVVGNRIDHYNNDISDSNDTLKNDINDCNTTLSALTLPSKQKVEEKKRFDNNNSHRVTSYDNDDEDDRIEYIDEIGPYDIICGRNNGAHNWIGNRRFRVTIMMHLQKYTESPTREEKTHVIKSVIELLLDKDGVGARFIKKVGEGVYERLKDKQIREKVGHAFRDMMSLEEKGANELEAKCFR